MAKVKDLTGLEVRSYYASDYDGADPATATWTEFFPRDEAVNLPAGTADLSRRGTRVRRRKPTLQDWTSTFQLVYDASDATQTALRTAYLNGTQVGLAFMDQDIATVDAEGWVGNWSVTNFSTNRALEDGVLVDVEVVVSDGEQYYINAGP